MPGYRNLHNGSFIHDCHGCISWGREVAECGECGAAWALEWKTLPNGRAEPTRWVRSGQRYFPEGEFMQDEEPF